MIYGERESEREREREREKERERERDVRDKLPTLYKSNGIFFHCILYSV